MEEAQSISIALYEWGSEGVRKWARLHSRVLGDREDQAL